jgi:hypothetical protein
MEPQYMKSVQHFMETWPEGADPCSFFVTGGGFSLLDIGKIPGASKVFADAYIAYHMLEEVNFLRSVLGDNVNLLINGEVGFVSPWTTYWYARALLQRHVNTIPNATICVTNASLTTNRWRRGKNEAFIAVANRPCDRNDGVIKLFRYDMKKWSEEEYNQLVHDHQAAVENGMHPTDPIVARRMFEDQKVAEVALGLILENPSLVNMVERGEEVVPMNLPHDPMLHEVYKDIRVEKWLIRP